MSEPGPNMKFVMWHRIAWVAGIFSLVLGAMLLVNSLGMYRGTEKGQLRLVDSEALAERKAQLREDPKNEALTAEIRELDQSLRRETFRRETLAHQGTMMLVGGVTVFVIALQLALYHRRPKLPVPGVLGKLEDPKMEAAAAGRGAAVVTLALAGLGIALATGVSPKWQGAAARFAAEAGGEGAPGTEAGTKPSPALDPDWYPTDEEIAANWASFRGPGGLGMTHLKSVPKAWDGDSGENILWKVEGGLPGESSPVIWGDRVFAIGATEERREVSCFSLTDGKLLWREPVVTPAGSRAEPPEVMEMTGYAASTPVTDGRRVFGIFANGDVAGFSAEGELLWAKHLGVPESAYGHASSLAIWRNRVIVLLDQGGDGEAGKSRIMAFDAATGDEVWSNKRMVPNSWASPIIISVNGREQVITCAEPWVVAYDCETGKELWRVDCLEGDIAPSPVFMNGLVYVVTEATCLAAIRPDGSGDVTETHVAWMWDENDRPDMCSLLCDGPRLYMMVFGVLHAFDAMTGKWLWEYDIGEEFQASPTWVDGTIYMLSREGLMIMGTVDNEKFTETGRAEVDDETGASPVFAPGRILLRGKEFIYCIGGDDGK